MAGIDLAPPTSLGAMSKPKPLPVKPPGAPPLPPQTASAPMMNAAPMPIQSTPLQAPNLPQSPQAPTFNYVPPTLGAAPTATPYGAFTAPDPTKMAADPYYQFRLDQANKGAQRSAFAHGTGLSGGFQVALAKLNQGLASEEGDKIYGRALSDYRENRATNEQNYGQSLAGYTAGTGATLGASRLGLEGATAGYDRKYGASRDAYHDARDNALMQNDVLTTNNAAQDAYRRQMEAYRASLAPRPSLGGY